MARIERSGFVPLLSIPNGSTQGRPMFRSLGIAGSGMSAQRQRMETIAQNIANADVTRGANGAPYKRRDVVIETANGQTAVFAPGMAGAGAPGGAGIGAVGSPSDSTTMAASGDRTQSVEVPVLNGAASMIGPDNGQVGVRVAGVVEDTGDGRLVYEPGHPDADANGYVRYPDIDTTQELVKLMDAKRIYEANASVFQTAKSILRASLDI